MSCSCDISTMKNYLDFLKKISKNNISSIIDLLPEIISKYDRSEKLGELNKNEIQYLEYVWTLFKLIFWDNETILTLDSKLIGPFFLEIDNKFQWITINISAGQNRYLRTRPFGLYIFESSKFYVINNSFKSKLFEEPQFKDSNFNKYNIFKNINEHQADTIALQFRVNFYAIKIEIENFKTNNLVVLKIEYEENKFIKLYTLVDYGIYDPELNGMIGENSGSINDLLQLFNISFLMFN
jgi:hypothetical protein